MSSYRDKFDSAAWLAAIIRHKEARRVTWCVIAYRTGIGRDSLCRIAAGKRLPDAAALAVLSAWAGIDPSTYCGEFNNTGIRKEP